MAKVKPTTFLPGEYGVSLHLSCFSGQKSKYLYRLHVKFLRKYQKGTETTKLFACDFSVRSVCNSKYESSTHSALHLEKVKAVGRFVKVTVKNGMKMKRWLEKENDAHPDSLHSVSGRDQTTVRERPSSPTVHTHSLE